ncbi:hypothetical protein BH23PAT2_BH23PAT2_07920 [soil metagenome]
MSKKSAERKQEQNEAVFRNANEEVTKGLHDLEEMANTEGYAELPDKDNLPIHFFCECSDENCRERIVMDLTEYDDLHNNRKLFVIKPKHEVRQIEKVVKKNADHWIVKKNNQPLESANTLQPTKTKNV